MTGESLGLNRSWDWYSATQDQGRGERERERERERKDASHTEKDMSRGEVVEVN